MKICFLFNHDAAHQVAHSIGVAIELAEKYPEIETVIAFGSASIRREIETHLTPKQIAALIWQDLSLAPWLNSMVYLLNRLFPARRLGRLLVGAKALRRFDFIISTERTCLMLKRKWKKDGPKFVFIPHGAGDRGVSYHQAMKDFDLMLVSGQKVQDQMVAHDIVVPEQCRIIGYPKFDALLKRTPEKFFDNDNPVFLYNPHFDPLLSSWYDHGEAILEWFYNNQDRYNLIFAPHVMLFFKTAHVSLEYKKGRLRPDVGEKYFSAPNIRIDVDSPRLFDMSYTLAADAYIGDVSSQVYEFLYRTRPVYFIDTHSDANSSDDPVYEFWSMGPAVRNTAQLFPLLEQWQDIGQNYQARQQQLMDYTISIKLGKTAAERGAQAIVEAAEGHLKQEL